MTTAELDRISYLIIQAAIEIHKALGPGLLESAYRTCMIYELRARKLQFVSELVVPVRYKELVLNGGYRLDLLVEDSVVVELKSLEVVLPVHRAQVLSYLRLMDKRLGLLINFNVDRLVVGVNRVVNNFGARDLTSIAPAGEASRCRRWRAIAARPSWSLISLRLCASASKSGSMAATSLLAY
jgi:GxxExxY protein